MDTRSKLAIGRVTAALLLIVGSVVAISAQEKDSTAKLLSQFDNGTIKGNVYENQLLGLRIKFPSSMQVDPPTEVTADVKAGIEMLRAGKSVDEKRVAEMLQKERMIFAVSTPQTAQTVGASLSLTIKKDETREELRSMVDRTIKFFTESGQFIVVKGSSEQISGGLKFVTFTLSAEANGTLVYSRSFATRRNGHLLTFAIGYIDAPELAKMEAVIEKIELF